MQVDYGEGAPTRHPRTGKYRKLRLFVLTLSNSRHAFRKVGWNSSSQTWCKLHEEAFAYFGGTARTIRFDNLKEGVLKPDIYDPELNPLYAKLLDHYGVIPLPCRPYAPDLKGKVESTVGHTQETALKGRRFESIDEQNAHLLRWNERWAATRIHGTTKRQVRVMFEEEKPFLQQLPLPGSNTTVSASAPFTSMASSRSTAPTITRRRTRRNPGRRSHWPLVDPDHRSQNPAAHSRARRDRQRPAPHCRRVPSQADAGEG